MIAHSADGPNWIGRDLSNSPLSPGIFAARDSAKWSAGRTMSSASPVRRRPSLVPWLVSVGLPTDVAFAAVVWRLSVGVLFTLVTLLLAFGIAWMLSGTIVRPLRQLRPGCVRACRRRPRPSHARCRPTDEIGVLADAFNQMAAALEQREEDATRAADDLKQAKDTLAAVIDASPVAIVCSDLDRRIFMWNRAAERSSATPPRKPSASSRAMMPPRQARTRSDAVQAGVDRRDRARPARQARAQGRHRWSTSAPRPRRCTIADGTVRGVARAYEDITDRVRAEEQLKRIAHYDQLTGLPNRLTLQKELGRLLRRRRRADRDRAVRSRRLQGRQRYARSFDRRPAADRGRPASGRGRGRPRPGLPPRRRRVRRDRPRLRRPAGRRRDRRQRCSSG